MQSTSQKIQAKYIKPSVVALKSGDTIRVHQKIVEGGKERIQIFEGLVIKVGRKKSLTQTFTVRRIASGVGVEKTYLIHSPNVLKIEITKRSKVRRNYLSYMRSLTGKSARLTSVDFDRKAVNEVQDKATELEEAKIHSQHVAEHDEIAAETAAEESAATQSLENAMSEADKLEETSILKPSGKNPAEPQNVEK